MDNSGQELDQLSGELQAAIHEFDKKLSRMTSLNVIIPTGIKRSRTFHMSALLLSWIINLLNLICFGTGLAFAFLGGLISTVGVALLVGSLFSEGAFAGQLWVTAHQSGSEIYDRLWGEETIEHLKHLKSTIGDLSERIDRYREASETPNTAD